MAVYFQNDGHAMLPAACGSRNEAGRPSKGAETISAEGDYPNPDWLDTAQDKLWAV